MFSWHFLDFPVFCMGSTCFGTCNNTIFNPSQTFIVTSYSNRFLSWTYRKLFFSKRLLQAYISTLAYLCSVDNSDLDIIAVSWHFHRCLKPHLTGIVLYGWFFVSRQFLRMWYYLTSSSWYRKELKELSPYWFSVLSSLQELWSVKFDWSLYWFTMFNDGSLIYYFYCLKIRS